jgi:hypothetical protein
MHTSACSLLTLLALASAAAAQGYITSFETFTASAAGTPMAGQDGFYIPAVAGSIDGAMYTYAGNPHGVPANPNGGAQFWAGASQGAAAPARSQRALTLPSGKIRVEYDVCVTYTGGTVVPTNNIGSFSFQPSTNAIYVNLLAAWPVGVTAPPTTWDANVVTRGATPPATVTTILPNAAFQGLPVGVWHRWGCTIDLVAGTHDSFSITNGATNVTTTYVPATPLLLPVAPSLPAPLPTDFRLFGGGGLGNVIAIDNLVISDAADFTNYGTGCAGSLGVPSLTCTSLPALGSTLTLSVDNMPLNVGIMIAGLSDQFAAGSIPLPLDLTAFGWPGCNLLADAVVTDTLLGTANTATWSLPIPSATLFLGFTIYNQGAVLTTGPSSLAFSNGGRSRIGF